MIRTGNGWTAVTLTSGALVCALWAAATVSPLAAQTRSSPARDAGMPAPDNVGAGELLWRSPEGWIALPIDGIDVDLQVTGLMVRGTVTQRFHNPTDRVIDALYVFPLPDRAAVRAMEMRIGERRIRSVVREREDARREFESARAEGRKAALVEQLRPNLFTSSAANLNPGDSIEIVLEYVEESTYRDGSFELAVPLTFTPRAAAADPAGRADARAQSTTASARGGGFVSSADPAAPRASVVVRLDTGLPLREVVSSSHRIVTEASDGGFVVRPVGGRVVADRDFRLRWIPQLGSAPRTVALVEERDGERFLLLLMVPPEAQSEAGLGLPTETLFVVDVSSSMAGPSIGQARRALLAALERLRPEDRFNLMAFNHETAAFRPQFLHADEQNLIEARRWVRALQPEGGTRIDTALMHGLELAGSSRSAHAQRIVFLTDGAVGNEAQVLGAVRERLGEVRLHTLGIGQAPNSWLMRKMAEHGRGLCEFISATEAVDNRIDAFLARLDRPVATDLQLSWEGLEPRDVHPRTLPDLHAGEALVVSARLGSRGDAGAVRLEAYTRAGWIDVKASLTDARRRDPGIASRWARAEVESLIDTLHEGATPFDVRASVVEVALAHGLVTRYTSRVAVDDTPSSLGPAHPARMAAALPRGGGDGPWRVRLGSLLALLGLLSLVGLRRQWSA